MRFAPLTRLCFHGRVNAGTCTFLYSRSRRCLQVCASVPVTKDERLHNFSPEPDLQPLQRRGSKTAPLRRKLCITSQWRWDVDETEGEYGQSVLMNSK